MPVIQHNSLIAWQPDKTFTEAALLPLWDILFMDPAKMTADPEEKNRLLRQKRDALIDYWLVTVHSLQRSEMDLSGADLSGVNLSYIGSEELILPGPIQFSFPRKVKINLAKARLIGADLTGIRITNADFSDTDLSYADLSGASFLITNLTNVILCRARATDVLTLHEVCLSGAVLDGAGLDYVDVLKSDLRRISMREGKLHGSFCTVGLSGADLSKVDLSGTSFINCSLCDADMKGANLTACQLFNTQLDGLCLYGANLTKCGGVTHVTCIHNEQWKDISTYRHANVYLDEAYKETRLTDTSGKEIVMREPVTLEEFNQMNSFELSDNLW